MGTRSKKIIGTKPEKRFFGATPEKRKIKKSKIIGTKSKKRKNDWEKA